MKYSLLIPCLILSVLCGCHRQSADIWPGDTDDMEVNSELVSVDEDLPALGSLLNLYMCGDTLIIEDIKSRENKLVAYEINENKYLGSFLRYGNGPDEISNGGAYGYDENKHLLYLIDANRWVILSADISKALDNPDYHYGLVVKMDESDGRIPVNRPYCMNDSILIGTIYICNENYTSVTNHVGQLNILTGKCKVLDSMEEEYNSEATCAISPEDNRIISVGHTYDRIRIFDMEANLLKEIKGTRFKDKPEGRIQYFASPVIANHKLYALYLGDDWMEKKGDGDVIMEFDLDGNYLRSMKFDMQLNRIVYHPGTNRLYVATNGTPQVGYLQL